MDYVFDLDGSIELFDVLDGSKVAEFVLGYELEMDTIVYMQVLLVPGESYLHYELGGVYDLQFGIREKLAEDNNIRTSIDFSYLSTRRFIPRIYRDSVAEIVLTCVSELITAFNPTHITMETYHSNVPPEAMVKYERIATLLRERFDYEMPERFRGTDDGIDYWYFRRPLLGPVLRLETLRRYLRHAMYLALERMP